MKQKLLCLQKRKIFSFVASLTIFLCSCIEGYEDDPEFAPSVQNTLLNSPKAENIKIIPSADGATVRIEWPVVHGAGGYEFTLFINDDPANPKIVGEENEIIDGSFAIRPLLDDTNYKVSVKTLGNEKYNNKEANSPSEKEFTTLLPTYATIPSGTDISSWFSDNPMPVDSIGTELAYVLEPGGQYTLSSPIDFGNQKVTFRGEKMNRASITMGETSRISTSAGLKIKFINFDCNAIGGASSTAALILLSSNPNPEIKGVGDYYIVKDPVVLQSCDITGVQRNLIFDNKIKYCLTTLLIKDCNVKLETTQEQPVISFNQGFANDFTVENSTFWHTGIKNNNYFVQYNGSGRPTRAGFINGSVNYLNNTFYHVCYNKQWGNYNGFAGQSSVYWNMKNNIFLDSGKGEVARRFLGGRSNQPTATFGNNSYWYEGAFPEEERKYDTAISIESDPQLLDPSNGNFTVQGQEQIAARSGDPRWLPVLSEE
jgi:hypothetical protein